jgi:cytosine/adenosine deaminase-related metal-dependent hydrolase
MHNNRFPTTRLETPNSDTHDRYADGGTAGGLLRRDFLKASTAGLVAGAIADTRLTGTALAAEVAHGRRILLKGGVVLTLDPNLGDFEKADVLIDGSKIAAVGPNIEASAVVIDASNLIVMPGFVDTHRHIWQGQLRNILPNGQLNPDYMRDILGTARSVYRPEDAYIGDLVSALSAINAGVTTLLDWSHIGNSPEHTDAAIEGLRESGIRGVYAYGSGTAGPLNQFPQDIRRLRKQYFSSDDQLLTLAMAAGLNPEPWAVAREVGAPITLHVNGTGTLLPLAKVMSPDNTYIHCANLTEDEWKLIASTGGGVSIAGPIEMEMGHGVPPYQQALDHRVPLSLSNDVETEIPTEFFTQMRIAFFLQRMLVFSRQRASETTVPPLLTVREVVEIATIGGARVNHLARKIGTLTPGKEADIIMLDMEQVNVFPVNHAYGAVVLGMDTINVKNVFIGGRLMKWKGELVGVDLKPIRQTAERSRDYLLAQAGWPPTLLGGYLPGH